MRSMSITCAEVAIVLLASHGGRDTPIAVLCKSRTEKICLNRALSSLLASESRYLARLGARLRNAILAGKLTSSLPDSRADRKRDWPH